MIFQKHAKKCIESFISVDDEAVEIVQNYKYFGTFISSTGNFSLALDKLKEKSLTPFSVLENTKFSANYLHY